MLSILIPVCFILSFYIFNYHKKIEWRYSFILSSLLIGSLTVVFTETLSYLMLLTLNGLAISWIISLFALIIYIIFSTSFKNEYFKKKIYIIIYEFNQFKLLYIYLIIILIFTALAAWISPPNTFDSMTYHMSRVSHWIQNTTVDFYPTTIFRQLVSAPFSEYAIANTEILLGSDKLANFVQWFSAFGCLVVISAITSVLGVSTFGQIASAIVCASIPMGILQSTSTQNDYVVSFWLAIFVYCVFRWIKNQNLLSSIAIGISFGLAILTKPTAYIYALPFVIYLAAFSLYKINMKKVVLLTTSLFIILALNSNHFFRNFESFGRPIAQSLDSGNYSYENEIFGPKTTISNLMRNAGLHLENGNRFDRLFQRSIEKLHILLNISINDARTTWPEYKFKVMGSSHHEDYAGNYYHLLLIILCIFLYFVFIPKQTIVTVYVTLLLFAFIIFSSYLRWQPWHSRLQLPLFVLWCPFVGLVINYLNDYRVKNLIVIKIPFLFNLSFLSNFLSKSFHNIKISNIILFILIYSSFPSLFLSSTKPMFGENNIFNKSRNLQLFSANNHFQDSYVGVIDFIKSKKCDKIGLAGFADEWEYPLWALPHEGKLGSITIEYISTPYNITNNKLLINNNLFIPCAIVASSKNTNTQILYKNDIFSLNFISEYLKVYTRD